MVKAMTTIVVTDINMVERVALTVSMCVNPSNPDTVDDDARVHTNNHLQCSTFR